MHRFFVFRWIIFFTWILSACYRIAPIRIQETPLIEVSAQILIPTVVPGQNISTAKIVTIEPIVITSVTSTKSANPSPTKNPTQTEIPRTMCSPLKDETISSLWEIITNPFGSPPVGREDLHHGVDFAYYRRGERLSIDGEIIQSILPGNVAASINDRLPYGNMVIIETDETMLPEEINKQFKISAGESLYSLYAHMGQAPNVGLGDAVTCGQELGSVGASGYDIINPHLHLETRVGPSEVRFKDMAFYDTNASSEEMDNYKRWRTSGDFRNIDPMLIFATYLSSQNIGVITPAP